MTTKRRLNDCGISRRDMMRIGAGGLGFSLIGGIGPVPYVLSQASQAAITSQSAASCAPMSCTEQLPAKKPGNLSTFTGLVRRMASGASP